jgi:hypothetical protein
LEGVFPFELDLIDDPICEEATVVK